MAQSTVALIILGVTIVLFVMDRIPLAITAVGASIAMYLFGVLDAKAAFAGFSNDTTMMVIGAIIIGNALFETGVAQLIGKTIIKVVGTNERLFIVAVVLVSAVLSAFLSNTAVVAMMLPVCAATAAKSGGKITKKNTYMPVGFAANVGGGMTLVGSTPNVIGQGLLVAEGLAGMSFFDLTLGSLPRLIFMLVFYATIGLTLEKKLFDFEEVATETVEDDDTKEYSKPKMIMSVAILVFAVAGFVIGFWTVGMVAMVAGIACVVTGCISVKRMFETMDWNTVWVLAGALGFAQGVSTSGAGQLIADTFIGFLGDNATMFNMLLLFTILGVVLGNLMSSTASMAMVGPIAIAMCNALGYDPKPIIMVIIWALNLAFLTPTGTCVVTLTLQGGYRFLDYTKIGAIVTVGCLIFTVITYPFVFAAYL